MSPRVPVTILGATGVVGQRLAARLARHPWFQIAHLCASERSAGKRYAEACAWLLGPERGPAHAGLGERVIERCDPAAVAAPLVFSALDTAAARELEPLFARAGSFVCSNASALRGEPDVPVLIPEVNAAHLELVKLQRKQRGWSGAIVCKPNCTTAPVALALAPLHAAFGLEKLVMVSLQALSGAGYPGVSALDIVGNAIPYVPGDEDKLEPELRKLLGGIGAAGLLPSALSASASCHRVPVADGHLAALSVALRGAPTPAQAREALEAWNEGAERERLPSSPPRPLRLHDAQDRPQPKLDVETDGGMSAHVGRIRACAVLGLKLEVLAHNAERGAAGGNLLNAELAHTRGLIA